MSKIYLADKETLDKVDINVTRVLRKLGVIVPLSWADVQAIVRAGEARDYFFEGDLLACNYNGEELIWQVIGIDVDTPTDSQYTHSLTLQTRDCIASMMFDNKEPDNTDNNRKSYGNNRYIHSAIKQWLNSTSSSFQWQSQHSYDAAPEGYPSAGFLHGLDPELKAVIGTVHRKVARNTVTDGGGQDSYTDKIFLPTQLEVGLGAEGEVAGEKFYPYYADATKRIKLLNGAASNWWLSSPHVTHSSGVRLVNTSGALTSNNAHYSSGVAPACVVI